MSIFCHEYKESFYTHSNSYCTSPHPEVVPSLYLWAFFEGDAKKPFGTNSKFRVSYRLRFCDREKGKFSRVGVHLCFHMFSYGSVYSDEFLSRLNYIIWQKAYYIFVAGEGEWGRTEADEPRPNPTEARARPKPQGMKYRAQVRQPRRGAPPRQIRSASSGPSRGGPSTP